MVLAFPYDAVLVSAVRTLPGRRFDWDAREWVAPADDWVSVKLRKILHLYPELTCSPEVDAWLTAASERWIGHVRTSVYDGRGWWALDTLAGSPPPVLRESIVEHDGRALVPMTAQAAGVLAEMEPGRLSVAAARCLEYVERGEAPPPARLTFGSGVAGQRFSLQVLWDHDVAAAFARLPGAVQNELKVDPWIADQLDAFVALHQVEVTPAAGTSLLRSSPKTERRARRLRPPGRGRQIQSMRSRDVWAASSRRFSGQPFVTRSRLAAAFCLTNRGWARPSRRSPSSRPTMRFPPWSYARPR